LLKYSYAMTALTYNLVTPGYFNTLRIPIVRGRHFTASEIDQRAAVVVISESIARMLWPGEDPLGKTLRVGSAPATQADGRPFLASAEIVGVARDARAGMLFESQQSYLYLPLPPQEATLHLHLLLRTTRDLKQLAPVVMQDIRQMDPALCWRCGPSINCSAYGCCHRGSVPRRASFSALSRSSSRLSASTA
jgi:putative ABC transport system permease protein